MDRRLIFDVHTEVVREHLFLTCCTIASECCSSASFFLRNNSRMAYGGNRHWSQGRGHSRVSWHVLLTWMRGHSGSLTAGQMLCSSGMNPHIVNQIVIKAQKQKSFAVVAWENPFPEHGWSLLWHKRSDDRRSREVQNSSASSAPDWFMSLFLLFAAFALLPLHNKVSNELGKKKPIYLPNSELTRSHQLITWTGAGLEFIHENPVLHAQGRGLRLCCW